MPLATRFPIPSTIIPSSKSKLLVTSQPILTIFRSPGIFRSTANDSFSSIGSIPNFQALNSSPSPHVPAGPHNLTQVTCAYDSGTDENSFNAINSSFAAEDEAGKPKNVVIGSSLPILKK